MSDPFHPWPRLLDPATLPLRQAIAGGEADTVAGLARLKRVHGHELVIAAIELMAARAMAPDRFGGAIGAETIVADRAGMQQASSVAAATYKAQRMISAGFLDHPVLDLCCGIGADAFAMHGAGLRPLAVDHDPLRAWMARQNTGRPAACADVGDIEVCGRLVHIDPDRRSGSRRLWRLEDYRPGPSVLADLFSRVDACMAKFGPGVEGEVARSLAPAGELEFISEAGRLTQAVLWSEHFSRAPAAATRLEMGGKGCEDTDKDEHRASGELVPITLTGMPDEPPPFSPLSDFLATVDPAVERAGLLATLCRKLNLAMPHPETGILTGSAPVDSPWLAWFQLLEELPWRLKHVRAWLKAHDGGEVEVKTRGGAVDPNQVQKSLRGEGGTRYTLFILRFDRPVRALITRRLV